MILVAGPYRSGTSDDPALIAANLEDIALPLATLATLAGSKTMGDVAFDEIFHPVGRRLVGRCDAVQVFYDIADVPAAR